MKKITLSIITGFILVFTIASYADGTQADLADNFVRLHVIANSDTQKDQTLKLKIRDQIITEANKLFIKCENINDTKTVINNNMDFLEEIALNEIKSNGENYDVSINLGTFYFPTKEYGNMVLPAGEYEALKIIIGEGKGKNWWCVMFPPLCFVDATHGEMSAEVKTDLKNNLSKEEYALISEANENLNVKVKFKIIEIWNNSKEKVKKAFNNEEGTL
jgi:stage II sporulation protein R